MALEMQHRAFFAVRRAVHRLGNTPLRVPVLYIVAGVALAMLMVAIDARIAEPRLPTPLQLGPQTARTALIGLATSFLFVTSVVFWVRIWALQVSARPALPRVLSQFLTDRVQQHAMSFIAGGMAYTLSVVVTVPENGGADSSGVPHLATLLGFVIALVVAVIIVMVIHNAASAGQVGRLVRQITDESVALVRSIHPPVGQGADGAGRQPATPRRPAGRGHTVAATTSGWVRRIDEDALLASMPPRSFVELQVRVGSFVMEGGTVATVWTDDGRPPQHVGLRSGIVVGTEPSLKDNLAYGIGALNDIIERSMAVGDRDSTTAREAVLHLGVVLREILLHDLPPSYRTDNEGRQLVRLQDIGFTGYCDLSFGRVRDIGASSLELMSSLLTVLGMIADQLEEQGLHERRALLEQQAHMAIEDARNRMVLSRDVAQVQELARSCGLLTEQDAHDLPSGLTGSLQQR